MSSTLLEVTRAAHEEVDLLERLIVKELQKEKRSNKERLCQGHRVRDMIDNISSTTKKLIDMYEDKDNARKEEIAAIGGQTETAAGSNVFFSAFYDRLKEIREYYRKHPEAAWGVFDAANEEENEEEDALLLKLMAEFSGEEAFGRYVDLHELYNQYINSKFGQPIEYSAYLDVFSQPQSQIIPRKLKLLRQYKEYLQNLVAYLIYFFQRTEPLQDLDAIFSKVEETEFEDQESGHLLQQDQLTLIDLDCYSRVEEVMEVGPEKLKEALASLGLKTGGTVRERAERLFLTKDTPLAKLERKHIAKGSGGGSEQQVVINLKEIALLEGKVKKLCGLLKEAVDRTKDNIVKKQALTYEEIKAEREEQEEIETESHDEENEQQIHNPLKLPMGPDGKIISYWMYKLHGLGQEFKCEICGDSSYFGRRAFEIHFNEECHQRGMRCLGIPKTKSFNEITSIEEAKELWKRIQARQGANLWCPDLGEEYEDEEGNIYNKKTYNDLKRQGLL